MANQNFNTFVITKNHPSVTDDGKLKIRTDFVKTKEMKYKFRLYDDDGELYFSGYSSKMDSFVPLDYYGENFGCTRIDYYNEKKWSML